MPDITCTICGMPTQDAEVCPDCAENFAGQSTPAPRWLRIVPPGGLPPTWWVEARLPLAPPEEPLGA